MNVVKKIIKRKKEMLRQGLFPSVPPAQAKTKNRVFARAISSGALSLITEIKRASPSAGRITLKSVEELAEIYARSRACCISVLTEDKYFGGSGEDIAKVKKITSKPVLMKDFIVFKEQIYLASCCGADAILLIASLLSEKKLKEFNRIARQCGLDAINEIHSRQDLNKLRFCSAEVDIMGVNSRNLKTLKINGSLHRRLRPSLKPGALKVAESGIKTPGRTRELHELGYDAVLIGESVLKSADPEKRIRELASF